MLDKIRKFSKTALAKVLLVIIIIPFVFWGMGGVFSGGNTNNIAKINNKSISTKDFIDHLNSINLDSNYIRENIQNNIIEENLALVISRTMLSMEVEDLDLAISDKVLNQVIKNNKEFQDDNGFFSRIKYEKFLLSNNMSAPEFEYRLRESELKKNLFSYISGGLNPPTFLVNNVFKQQTKKISINYFSLEDNYKKKEDFTDKEIVKFVNENKENLQEKYINFKYIKLTPKNLIGINEFNDLFFEKIDEIENDLSNGTPLENIENKYQLKLEVKNNFNLEKNTGDNKFYEKIYKNSETNKQGLLDQNEYYVLYEISNIEKKIPKINNKVFRSKIKNILFNKYKFNFNNELAVRINEKKFTQIDFDKLSKKNKTKVELTEINSFNDINKFSTDSIKYLYSLNKNNFALIYDLDKKIYLAKIVKISDTDISKNSQNFINYQKQTSAKMIENIYNSYDLFLNNKYKVKINEKTVERVRNYFQ